MNASTAGPAGPAVVVALFAPALQSFVSGADIPQVEDTATDAVSRRRSPRGSPARAERRLFETEAKYTNLLEQLPAAIYIDSPEPSGPIYYVSPRIRELLGISPAEYIARAGDWDSFIHPDDRDRVEADYSIVPRDRVSPRVATTATCTPTGTSCGSTTAPSSFATSDGHPMFVQGVMFDITAQKEAELSLQHMAYHDTLTGLPNRAMFEEHLDLAVARARRYDRSVAVLFMDLDGFKDVNDSMGHAAGDELLCVVAARLREATRDTDLVARLGGDEFLVLLADLPDDRGSSRPMASCKRSPTGWATPSASRCRCEDRTVEITISVGSSVFPFEARDVEELMSRADAAMYAHKRRGAVARMGDRRQAGPARDRARCRRRPIWVMESNSSPDAHLPRRASSKAIHRTCELLGLVGVGLALDETGRQVEGAGLVGRGVGEREPQQLAPACSARNAGLLGELALRAVERVVADRHAALGDLPGVAAERVAVLPDEQHAGHASSSATTPTACVRGCTTP